MRGVIKNYVFGEQRAVAKPSHYWRFNSNSVDQITGLVITATLNPELISYSEAKIDNGVFFNGDRTGFRRFGMSFTGLRVWNDEGDIPFSFSVWVKKTETNGTSGIIFQTIKNTLIGVTGAGGSYLTAWVIGVDSVTDAVILYLRDDINGTLKITSTSQIERNEWCLIQVLYDGNKNARIFVNNVEDSSLNIVDTGYISMKNSSPYGVGISSNSQSNYSGGTFIGGMDEMAFWNGHLLTEEERNYIWNDGNGRQIF